MAKKAKVHARRKGVVFERQMANYLTELTGVKWRRTQQHSAAGVVGDIEVAVDAGPITEAQKLWRLLHVECKNNEKMHIGTKLLEQAMAQAERDCPSGKCPVVLYKERLGTVCLYCYADTIDHGLVPVCVTGDKNIRSMLAQCATDQRLSNIAT